MKLLQAKATFPSRGFSWIQETTLLILQNVCIPKTNSLISALSRESYNSFYFFSLFFCFSQGDIWRGLNSPQAQQQLGEQWSTLTFQTASRPDRPLWISTGGFCFLHHIMFIAFQHIIQLPLSQVATKCSMLKQSGDFPSLVTKFVGF